MTRDGTILVTGANGNVSSALIPLLTAAGAKVRGLIRDEAKAQGLKDAGVDVVIGDLEKPESLDAAFSGVDRVFLVTPVSPDAVSMASNAIAAAKRAGSPYIVRLSAIKAALDSRTRIGRQHAEIEAKLISSGLPHTILRPHFFMQNTMMAAQSVAADGALYMAFKDGRFGIIDIRDVADVAAAILASDGHEGKNYLLTGPKSITMTDVAEGLSKAVGKKVAYHDVPPETARQAMVDMGLPEWLTDAYVEYFIAYSEGWGDVTTNYVEELTGHPARSYETFARDFAKAFGG